MGCLRAITAAFLAIANVGAPNPAHAASAVALAPEFEARLRAMEQALEAKRRELGVPGLSLVVVKDGRVLYEKGFGVRSLADARSVTPDTLFAIGSSAKAFTGALAAIAVDEGKVSLDDHPRKHLPYFRLSDAEADRKITLRDLMIHNSGLARTELLWIPGALTREEVIKAAGEAKPTAPLGQRFQYQNVMFAAAGEAVASAQGSTWEALMRDRLLRPLGMASTRLRASDLLSAPNRASGHLVDPKTGKAKPSDFAARVRAMESVAPAGAIYSNGRDMAQWLKFMLNDGVYGKRRLVSERMFEAMTQPQFENVNGSTVDYGLGWFLLERGGKRVVQHGGSAFGYRTQVSLMPEERLGFVLMANAETPLVGGEARGGLGDEIIWSSLLDPVQTASGPVLSPAPEAGAAPVDPALLGTYRAEVRGRTLSFDLVERGGRLVLNRTGQQPLLLTRRGEDLFGIQGATDGYAVEVRRDQRGVVRSLLFREPNGSVELARAEPYQPPISAEELMRRAVTAAGGEAALRKHKTRLTEFEVDLVNQGVKGTGWTEMRAPDARTTSVVLTAAGKQLAWTREWFDGEKGGVQSSFQPAEEFGPEQAARQRLMAELHGPADWRTRFKSVVIDGEAEVGGEKAFVVVKTPAEGAPVRDYISARTYLLLRRDDSQGVTTYGGYKPVDGVVLPYRWVTATADTGEQIVTVKRIRFDVPITGLNFAPTVANHND